MTYCYTKRVAYKFYCPSVYVSYCYTVIPSHYNCQLFDVSSSFKRFIESITEMSVICLPSGSSHVRRAVRSKPTKHNRCADHSWRLWVGNFMHINVNNLHACYFGLIAECDCDCATVAQAKRVLYYYTTHSLTHSSFLLRLLHVMRHADFASCIPTT